MEERISMSSKDLNRLEVLTDVKERRLKQSKGARLLGISPRQFKRLLGKFRAEGSKGVSGFSISSMRNVMIKHGLWHAKEIRELKVHPLRPRRSKIGELIQLDGSEHDWFEGRGPRCTLLVFIDDATSETLHLKFVKSENTFDYLSAAREYMDFYRTCQKLAS